MPEPIFPWTIAVSRITGDEVIAPEIGWLRRRDANSKAGLTPPHTQTYFLSLSHHVFLHPGKLGQACAPLGNKARQEPEPAQEAGRQDIRVVSGSHWCPGVPSGTTLQGLPVLTLAEVPDLLSGPLRPHGLFSHFLLGPPFISLQGEAAPTSWMVGLTF